MSKRQKGMPPMPSATDPHLPVVSGWLLLSLERRLSDGYERSFSTRSVWQIDLLVILWNETETLFVFSMYAWYVLLYRKGTLDGPGQPGWFFLFYSNFPRGVPVISYWSPFFPFGLCVVVDVFGHNEMRSGWKGSEVMLGQMFVHGDVV
jgi:hypothetical protein